MTGEEKTLRAKIGRLADRLGDGPGVQAEIARQCGCSREYVGQVLGRRGKRTATRPPRPSHKIYAHGREFKAAQRAAKSLGYVLLSGENTGEGSIGLMVEAIGGGDVVALPRPMYEKLQSLADLGAIIAKDTLSVMGDNE